MGTQSTSGMFYCMFLYVSCQKYVFCMFVKIAGIKSMFYVLLWLVPTHFNMIGSHSLISHCVYWTSIAQYSNAPGALPCKGHNTNRSAQAAALAAGRQHRPQRAGYSTGGRSGHSAQAAAVAATGRRVGHSAQTTAQTALLAAARTSEHFNEC